LSTRLPSSRILASDAAVALGRHADHDHAAHQVAAVLIELGLGRVAARAGGHILDLLHGRRRVLDHDADVAGVDDLARIGGNLLRNDHAAALDGAS
jgi:hypothetical protein